MFLGQGQMGRSDRVCRSVKILKINHAFILALSRLRQDIHDTESSQNVAVMIEASSLRG